MHELSVVVPDYRGEFVLPALVERLEPLTSDSLTPAGHRFRVSEVLLVYDWGPDRSDDTIRALSEKYPFVAPVWLMRGVGQHAATAAGIASTTSDWVVTMDEDGQHDPAELGRMLDVALSDGADLVYGVNTSRTPHPRWRNATSKAAKWVARVVCASTLDQFTSYRLIEGSRARSACAFIGTRTFLDVALTWTVARSATCGVEPGVEGRPGSGYRLKSLVSHFWTLALSSGTRPLRIISALGLVSAVLGIIGGITVVTLKFTRGFDAQGWASVFIAVIVMGGAILFSVGVVAEYIGATLRTVQGRPAFVIGNDPLSARRPARASETSAAPLAVPAVAAAALSEAPHSHT